MYNLCSMMTGSSHLRCLEISLNRLNEIVLGKRGITADTVIRCLLHRCRRDPPGSHFYRNGTTGVPFRWLGPAVAPGEILLEEF